jgi:SNF2 family DNA or RNA helicase
MAHQRAGVEFLKHRPRAALFDEPGLGKSAQALLAAVEPVLVVAPAMILDGGVWDDEIERWCPGASVHQVSYSSLSERTRTVSGGSSATGALRADLAREWGTVIFDEAHYLKGRKTKWTRAAIELAKKTDRLVELTGTPIPNWAHEAFVLLQLIYPEESRAGQRLGSYWRWAAEWFEVGPLYSRKGLKLADMAVGPFREDKHTWEEFAAVNWGDRCLRRLREECLDLPPMTRHTILVDMGPAQRKAYRELARDFVTWLDSGVEVSAWNNAAQLIKLCKCSTGLDVLDAETKGSGKLDALEQLLADRELPTLVVAHFRDTVDACARRAEAAGRSAVVVRGGVSKANRRQAVRAFQRGEVDVLCATLDTISEGLTLTVADQVIFVERSWRPSRNEQALRRIHRIGTKRPVSAIDLVTRKSSDERVLAVLAAKNDQQMAALDVATLRGLID